MKRHQAGFTLIEIAIVLVIVGLLLGGVLKGQELIVQARIKNVAADFNGVASAILSYQDRYRALPGDDNKAGTRWTGAADGDFDGTLEGRFNSTTDADESRLLWRHLRLAGFIAGDSASATQPTNAAGGIVGVQGSAGSVTSGTTTTVEQNSLVVCASRLPGKIASAIDAQFDDGLPNKGSVRGYTESGGDDPTAAASSNAYAEDGDKTFTVCKPV